MAPSWIMQMYIPKVDTTMAKGNSKFKDASPIELNESLRTKNSVCFCHLWKNSTHKIQMHDNINITNAILNQCFFK